MGFKKNLNRQRARRKFRVRNRVKAFSTRPRLAVFRSHKHIYAQVIDDENNVCVASASSMDKELRGELKYGGNRDAAAAVGKAVAERALKAGVTKVVLDRREYKYHGRVAALADAARTAGLELGGKPAEPKEKAADEGGKKGGKGDAKKGDKKKAEKK